MNFPKVLANRARLFLAAVFTGLFFLYPYVRNMTRENVLERDIAPNETVFVEGAPGSVPATTLKLVRITNKRDVLGDEARVIVLEEESGEGRAAERLELTAAHNRVAEAAGHAHIYGLISVSEDGIRIRIRRK